MQIPVHPALQAILMARSQGGSRAEAYIVSQCRLVPCLDEEVIREARVFEVVADRSYVTGKLHRSIQDARLEQAILDEEVDDVQHPSSMCTGMVRVAKVSCLYRSQKARHDVFLDTKVAEQTGPLRVNICSSV